MGLFFFMNCLSRAARPSVSWRAPETKARHRAETFVSSAAPVSRSPRCQNRLPVSHLSVSLPRSVSAPTTAQVGYNHPDEAKIRSMGGKDAKSKSDRKGEEIGRAH